MESGTKKTGKASGKRGNGHGKGSAADQRGGWQGGKWIRETTRRRLYMRDNFTCAYCGVSALDTDAILTLDHIVPRELGGTNAHSNLVACCKSCNSSKRHTPTARFLDKLEKTKGIDKEAVARRIRNRTRRALPKLTKSPEDRG